MNQKQLRNFAAFVIIIAGIAALLNNPNITGFAVADTRSIDNILSVDVKELRYELVASESKKIVFYAKNVADKQIQVDLSASGKSANFMTINEKRFLLAPNQSRPIEIEIYAPLESIPQVYFGDISLVADGRTKIIPVQIVVKKRIQDSLLMKISADKTLLTPGEELSMLVEITNNAREKATADITVRVARGEKEIYSAKDYVEIENSIAKNFLAFIPKGAEDGTYTVELHANARMDRQFSTFVDAKEIVVQRPLIVEQPTKTSYSFLWWITAGMVIAGLILIVGVLVRQEIIVLPDIRQVLPVGIRPKLEEKQYLKEGFSYIIDEKGTHASYQTVKMLHHEGYKVLCITRLNPKLLLAEVPELRLSRIYWLATQQGQDILGPTDVEGIFNVVDKFVSENEKSAILLDGLSFLSINTSFSQIVLLLQYIKDRISTARSIFIAPMNKSALEKREKEMLVDEVQVLDGARPIVHEMYRAAKHDERATKDDDIASLMSVTKPLLEYVSKELSAGFSEEDIVSVLTEHGWPPKIARDAVMVAKSGREGTGSNISQESSANMQTPGQGQTSAIPDEIIQKPLLQKASEMNTASPADMPVAGQSNTLARLGYLKKQFNETRQRVESLRPSGRLEPSIDLAMSALESDLTVANITLDEKDLYKVKLKMDEIRKKVM